MPQPQQRFPLPVTQNSDPVVESLLRFLLDIRTHCAKEPNLFYTEKVLNCLIFIRLNEEWLRYAVENKHTDDKIYTFPQDKEKGVLRDPNGLSFHIINYDSGDKAIADYNKTIEAIANGYESIKDNLLFISTFVRKIKNSDVGCMELRVSDALNFIVNPQLNLDYLFLEYEVKLKLEKIADSDFSKQLAAIHDVFGSYIGQNVYINGIEKTLDWPTVQSYFIDILAYDDNFFAVHQFAGQMFIAPAEEANQQQADTRITQKVFFSSRQFAFDFLDSWRMQYSIEDYHKPLPVFHYETHNGQNYYYLNLTPENIALLETNNTPLPRASIDSLILYIEAIQSNTLSTIREIISQNPQFLYFAIDSAGNNLFTIAMQNKNRELLEFVVNDLNFDLNKPPTDKKYPSYFLQCCAQDDVPEDMFNLLLAKKPQLVFGDESALAIITKRITEKKLTKELQSIYRISGVWTIDDTVNFYKGMLELINHLNNKLPFALILKTAITSLLSIQRKKIAAVLNKIDPRHKESFSEDTRRFRDTAEFNLHYIVNAAPVYKQIQRENPQGYDLVLMSELPENNAQAAEAGKIYLADNGDYIVRDLNNDVQQGKLEKDLKDKDIDLRDLANRLNELELKITVLTITADKGYTHPPKVGTEGLILRNAREHVLARKLWGDVVSATHSHNRNYIRQNNLEDKMAIRLEGLGYKNPKILIKACIDYLQNQTILVVNFDETFLHDKKLTSFQLLNLQESGKKLDSSFGNKRKIQEEALFAHLPEELRTEFLANPHAFPRYARLALIDVNDWPSLKKYGRSFIILKDIVKHVSLFSPTNTMGKFEKKNEVVKLASFTNLLLFLDQCDDTKLGALIQRLKTGAIPKSLNQESYLAPGEGYCVGFIPAIEIKKEFIETIHINKYQPHIREGYELKPPEINLIGQMAIHVSNDKTPPCDRIVQEFLTAIQKGSVSELEQMLTKHPSLITQGERAIIVAVESGKLNTVKYLHSKGFPLDNGVLDNPPLAHACANGRIEIFKFIIEEIAKQNQQTVKEAIALFSQRRSHLLGKAIGANNMELLEYLLEIGAYDINRLRIEGIFLLHYAVACNSEEMVKLLLRRGVSNFQTVNFYRADEIMWYNNGNNKERSTIFPNLKKRMITALQDAEISAFKLLNAEAPGLFTIPLNSQKESALTLAIKFKNMKAIDEILAFHSKQKELFFDNNHSSVASSFEQSQANSFIQVWAACFKQATAAAIKVGDKVTARKIAELYLPLYTTITNKRAADSYKTSLSFFGLVKLNFGCSAGAKSAAAHDVALFLQHPTPERYNKLYDDHEEALTTGELGFIVRALDLRSCCAADRIAEKREHPSPSLELSPLS